MAHLRKQIRDDVVTTLTGLSTTGSKVYASRVYPIDSIAYTVRVIQPEGTGVTTLVLEKN